MIDQINKAKMKFNDIVVEAQSYIKDKTIALDKRWEVYLSIEGCLETYESSEFDVLEGMCLSPYDDLCMERSQKLPLSWVLERLEDSEVLKEQVMQSGYGSYLNDW